MTCNLPQECILCEPPRIRRRDRRGRFNRLRPSPYFTEGSPFNRGKRIQVCQGCLERIFDRPLAAIEVRKL